MSTGFKQLVVLIGGGLDCASSSHILSYIKECLVVILSVEKHHGENSLHDALCICFNATECASFISIIRDCILSV